MFNNFDPPSISILEGNKFKKIKKLKQQEVLPLIGAFEDLALSVSIFQSKEECQLENAFEAAMHVYEIEHRKSNPCQATQACERQRERESTILTLL